MGKTTYTRDCEPDCLTRNCTMCGKFMGLVFEDSGSDWSRQEWSCKCGQVDIVEWSPDFECAERDWDSEADERRQEGKRTW